MESRGLLVVFYLSGSRVESKGLLVVDYLRGSRGGVEGPACGGLPEGKQGWSRRACLWWIT